MRILGVDPGIGRAGWGIIDDEHNKPVLVDCGTIETHKDTLLEKRLQEVHAKIVSLIEQYQPEALGIEDLFFNTNAKTALVVGQARGVILLAAAQKNLPVGVYTPLQVKMAVSGYGRAEKNQVGQMVKLLLKLETLPKLDDTVDALAIALTHSFSRKLGSKM